MALAIPWHGQNRRLIAPTGIDKEIIQDLPVFNNGTQWLLFCNGVY